MSFTIALSMRFITKQYPNGNEEIFNAIAFTWFDFLLTAFPDCSCLALPSSRKLCQNILNNHKVDAIILTGGDDIGVFLQRDEAEFALLKWAEQNHVPVIGVCRGMQVINAYYGGSLSEDKKHLTTRHKLLLELKYQHFFPKEVNSYHCNIVNNQNIASDLIPLAHANDADSIEALKHKNKDIYAIMWHPEREEVFNAYDIALFKKILQKQGL